jgi:heat shock protein HslJ
MHKYSLRIFILLSLIMLNGCNAIKSTPTEHNRNLADIQNIQWEWVKTVTQVKTVTANQPERYTLKLLDDGKVQARFDCNRGGGHYTASEGKLSFDQLFSTRMACMPDSQDATYMNNLNLITSFFIDGETLYLEMPIDSGTMKFRKAAPWK